MGDELSALGMVPVDFVPFPRILFSNWGMFSSSPFVYSFIHPFRCDSRQKVAGIPKGTGALTSPGLAAMAPDAD
jgi:hypothetical protein